MYLYMPNNYLKKTINSILSTEKDFEIIEKERKNYKDILIRSKQEIDSAPLNRGIALKKEKLISPILHIN